MRPGRACQRDANEAQIIDDLRAIPGLSVEQMDTPCDLLVGFRGVNWLLEVKDKGGKLTDDQVAFFNRHKGQVAIVRTTADVLRVLGIPGFSTTRAGP